MTAAVGRIAGVTGWKRAAVVPIGVAISTILVLELVLFTVVYPGFDAEKSPRPVADLAAQLTTPDETVGIFADDGLVGGILYYGNRSVEVLPRPQQVQSFLDRGGRYFILDRWKLPWLDHVGRFEVHATTRSNQREVAIVSRIP